MERYQETQAATNSWHPCPRGGGCNADNCVTTRCDGSPTPRGDMRLDAKDEILLDRVDAEQLVAADGLLRVAAIPRLDVVAV